MFHDHAPIHQPMMRTERLGLETRGEAEMIDITDKVAHLILNSGLKEGQVLIFCVGSTGGLTTIEYEPGLIRDFPLMFERLAPQGIHYHHEDTWHDGNGHSHCRASLLGPSLVVPVENGRMILGTWQQVLFIDFDNKPRHREIIVQISGLD
tara:strand:- start:90 stop:542 length:453 start_codon:yes stop_codon:yes gene_type:complete